MCFIFSNPKIVYKKVFNYLKINFGKSFPYNQLATIIDCIFLISFYAIYINVICIYIKYTVCPKKSSVKDF